MAFGVEKIEEAIIRCLDYATNIGFNIGFVQDVREACKSITSVSNLILQASAFLTPSNLVRFGSLGVFLGSKLFTKIIEKAHARGDIQLENIASAQLQQLLFQIEQLKQAATHTLQNERLQRQREPDAPHPDDNLIQMGVMAARRILAQTAPPNFNDDNNLTRHVDELCEELINVIYNPALVRRSQSWAEVLDTIELGNNLSEVIKGVVYQNVKFVPFTGTGLTYRLLQHLCNDLNNRVVYIDLNHLCERIEQKLEIAVRVVITQIQGRPDDTAAYASKVFSIIYHIFQERYLNLDLDLDIAVLGRQNNLSQEEITLCQELDNVVNDNYTQEQAAKFPDNLRQDGVKLLITRAYLATCLKFIKRLHFPYNLPTEVIKGGTDCVTSTWQLVRHPISSIKNIGSAVWHWQQTLSNTGSFIRHHPVRFLTGTVVNAAVFGGVKHLTKTVSTQVVSPAIGAAHDFTSMYYRPRILHYPIEPELFFDSSRTANHVITVTERSLKVRHLVTFQSTLTGLTANSIEHTQADEKQNTNKSEFEPLSIKKLVLSELNERIGNCNDPAELYDALIPGFSIEWRRDQSIRSASGFWQKEKIREPESIESHVIVSHNPTNLTSRNSHA